LKLLISGLIVLFVVLQGRLWFGDGGLHEVKRAKEEVTQLKAELARQRDINLALRAEVTDLGNGLGEIEERARAELGMIGADETFYQFVGQKSDSVPDTLAARPPVAGAAAPLPAAVPADTTITSTTAGEANPAAAKPARLEHTLN
jgi:cell division protein FtsB